MKTLYIDVYFLINLTVDFLAIHFAAILSSVTVSARRNLFSALVGSIIATVSILYAQGGVSKILCFAGGLIIISGLASKGIRVRRKIRFGLSFLICESVIGSLVSFMWDVLDTYVGESLFKLITVGVNRKLLFLALLVLLSVGVIKLIVTCFSDSVPSSSVKVRLNYLDKSLTLDAFVDSGNFATDPMDMSPVMLIKEDLAQKILPEAVVGFGDPDLLDKNTRKRIRLIPVSRCGQTHVLIGLKLDGVYLISPHNIEELRVTVAIDKEGGSYGGFEALMPATALKNV